MWPIMAPMPTDIWKSMQHWIFILCIYSYTWDFGDGTEVITWPEAVANHTYMTEGNYTALVMAHTDVSHANDTVSYIMFPWMSCSDGKYVEHHSVLNRDDIIIVCKEPVSNIPEHMKSTLPAIWIYYLGILAVKAWLRKRWTRVKKNNVFNMILIL